MLNIFLFQIPTSFQSTCLFLIKTPFEVTFLFLKQSLLNAILTCRNKKTVIFFLSTTFYNGLKSCDVLNNDMRHTGSHLAFTLSSSNSISQITQTTQNHSIPQATQNPSELQNPSGQEKLLGAPQNNYLHLFGLL